MAWMMHSWSHVSTRIIKILSTGLICATCLLSWTAQSKMITSRFLLPGATAGKIKIFNASNDFTLLLVSQTGTSAQIQKLREHFAQYPRVMVSFLAVPQGGWEGAITFNQKINRASIGSDKQGATLKVRANNLRSELLAHLDKSPPRSVPSRYTGTKFRNAERQLEAGNVRRATQMFIELGQDYALRSWSSLRLADLDLMLDNDVEACRSYNHLLEQEGHRIAGVLAEMRSVAVGCDDKKTFDINWEEIVNRISFADGPVSDYLWGEYLWVADFLAQTHKTALHFLSLEELKEKDPRVRLLPDTLRQKLFSRAIYMAPTTFDVARVYSRYAGALQGHPDKNGLRLEIARALLDLDLLDETEKILQPLLRESFTSTAHGWRERRGLAQAMVLTAWTYQALGQPVMMEAMAKIYRKRFKRGLKITKSASVTLGDFVFEEELKALRQGILNLKKAIRAEGRKPKSLIPNYDAARAKAEQSRGVK